MPLAAPVTTHTLSLTSMMNFLFPVDAVYRDVGQSALIQSLASRQAGGQPRHQVEHRRRQPGGSGKRRRRAYQHVDLHGAAELVILQDRWLVVGRRSGAGGAPDLGDEALGDAVG